jgi:hypothetical protein
MFVISAVLGLDEIPSCLPRLRQFVFCSDFVVLTLSYLLVRKLMKLEERISSIYLLCLGHAPN